MSRRILNCSPLIAVAALAVLALAGCGGPSTDITQPSLTYDGTAPAAPTGLTTALDAHNTRVLQWNPGAEPDLGSYQVYQYSPTPGSDNAYVLVATRSASTPYWVLPTPNNAVVTWFKICAVDATGNVGADSAPLMVTLAALSGGDESDPQGEEPRRR